MVVRPAASRGMDHNPYSGDDVRDVLDAGWSLAIFTRRAPHLAVSGVALVQRQTARTAEGAGFVQRLPDADIPGSHWRTRCRSSAPEYGNRSDHPGVAARSWQKQATCLWLKNLPHLTPTHVVDGRGQVHRMPPGTLAGRAVGHSPASRLPWQRSGETPHDRHRTTVKIHDPDGARWARRCKPGWKEQPWRKAR